MSIENEEVISELASESSGADASEGKQDVEQGDEEPAVSGAYRATIVNDQVLEELHLTSDIVDEAGLLSASEGAESQQSRPQIEAIN
eukprot:CAMPEP_0204235716 /NCGR_PEP_ID=MMETSP0361-20130328/91913_1 /ASSEMBLY_ACC=CAM_ASM_000343 /TAXON_ID=268821 /ORGANISM="Scrippsiella Hangoei, Strain SHTV-5" /LENGTH=86 /DNA_ID=CAMNT_0051207301 /DNA_START=51 /DNA_END=308 /DNA_ORIENTATION=+